MPNEPLLRFYRGEGTDDVGRRISDIWRYSPGELEGSFEAMLGFYSLLIAGDRIARAPDFAERSRVWLSVGNHNFLRLTRILKSLSLLGHEARAEWLLAFLEELYRERPDVIGSTTVGFWRRATSPGVAPGSA